MKDAATGFSFLAMSFIVLILVPYAYDVLEYSLGIHEKAEAYDLMKAQEPVFEEMAGMMLPVGRE